MAKKPSQPDNVTCEFDGKKALLIANSESLTRRPVRDVIADANVENSMWDRLHFKGDAVLREALEGHPKAVTDGSVTAQDMYDLAQRTQKDGFHVDKQSAVGGECDVKLPDGRMFQDVPMKVVPPGLNR